MAISVRDFSNPDKPIKSFYTSISLEKLLIRYDRILDKRNFEYREYFSEALKCSLLEITTELMAEKLQDTHVKLEVAIDYPASWWQHFKEDCFPKWLKNKFPVQNKRKFDSRSYDFKRFATYPKLIKSFPGDQNIVVIREEIDEY